MKDKELLKTVLNAYKLEHVDQEYTIQYLLDLQRRSKRFNWFNFEVGACVGMWFLLILKYFFNI